jgi:hypothetical protein
MSKPSNPPGRVPQGSGADDGSSSADSRQAAPKWLGKRIGRFRLQALIGQGAMGRVFRAEDTTLQRRVALKVISLFDRTGQINPAANRFLTEARAAAALEHPHVVQVFEAGEAGNVCFIAMELLEGGSLRELVDASGPLDAHRACQLTAEAAEALAHAHAAGIIHRDIKPANLMLSRHGRCKVTDFGLAVIDDGSTGPAPSLSERRVGTPLFAAPEVIRGASADERSDLYSLGATLFFLLTGRPPFIAHGRAEAMRAHLELPVPDIRAIRPDLPGGLAEAITRSLDKDPGGRFGSAEQFSRVLRVYTIPVAGAVAPAPAPIPIGGGGGGGGSSGSLAASSGGMSNYGTAGMSGSMYGSGGSGGLGGSGPLGATSRFAEMDNGNGGGGANDADQTSVMLSAIPVATVVPQARRFAGMSGAAWGGIAAGIIVAGSAIAWALLHASGARDSGHAVAAIPRQASQPAVVLAAQHETPAPTPAVVVPPASVMTTPPAPPPKPSPAATPAPSIAELVGSKPAPTPTPPVVAPKVSAPTNTSNTSTGDEIPSGVFHPRDMAALKRIADGTDPAHPDNRAVVQGKVVSAGPSSTGKLYHIHFAGVGGSDAFDVAYFRSSGMFEKMEQRFGGDVAAALVGKTIRVSGKIRLYHEGPEMVADSPDQIVIVGN